MAGRNVPVAETPPAVSVRLEVLRNRSDFLRAAKADRTGQPAFLLQAHNRKDDDPKIRVGYTCSKKVGDAVTRNRAKRRLREVARAVLPSLGHAGYDYVLVGRPSATVDRNFAQMTDDLRRALSKLHT
ncbi:ribonuclease P protein component [uncultured Litoreibacter sp.]|uniref:ribonuclease P protein component n=1 Tax=uncultured Litoreibacter sp. TaxID=1392394 RepID=UPI00262BB4AF|nr:ribonuclease P protein component [uncultured Litoreibacter sp.]